MPPPRHEHGRYFGRIKSFNPKHGFGFIECPEARSRYGRDVFVHKAQIGDLEVRDEVTFGIESNKDGYPQARDILRIDGRSPGPPPRGIMDDSRERKGGGKGGRDQQDGEGGKARKRRGGKGRKPRVTTDGKGGVVEEDTNGGPAKDTPPGTTEEKAAVEPPPAQVEAPPAAPPLEVSPG